MLVLPARKSGPKTTLLAAAGERERERERAATY